MAPSRTPSLPGASVYQAGSYTGTNPVMLANQAIGSRVLVGGQVVSGAGLQAAAVAADQAAADAWYPANWQTFVVNMAMNWPPGAAAGAADRLYLWKQYQSSLTEG